MTLRFLGIWPHTPDDGSPTIWVEEETGDLIIQSWKADEETIRQAQEVGSVPGHSTDVPPHEAVIRLPALDGWVMDEETVILHHFSGDGQWTGPRMEVVHDPALATQYLGAYDAAWERAIPHAEYRPA